MTSLHAGDIPLDDDRHGSKAPSEQSPTRVTDFDSNNFADKNEAGDLVDKVGDVPDPHPLSPPSIDITPYRRRERRSLMPTLEERSNSSAGEASSHDSRDEEERKVRFARFSESELRDSHASNPKLRQQEVKKLTVAASNLASRGKETQALQRYHRALKITRAEAMRVKHSLENKNLNSQEKHQRQSEWFVTATTIAEICTDMAVLYERIGDYKGALSSCREARAVYVKHSVNNKSFKSHAEQMQQMLTQLKKAQETFAERKRLHQHAIHTRKLISAMKDPKKKKDLYREVFRTLDAALNMERKILGESHPQVADTIGLLATANVEINNVDSALEQFRAAVSILRLSLGPHHPKTGMGLKQLGSLYDSRRSPPDMEKALKHYADAVSAFRESYGKNNALVGSTLNNMAVIYIQQKEYELAVETLSDALASYENVAINNNGLHPNTAQIWRNLGQVYSRRGEWESAILAYASSLEVQRATRRKTGDGQEGFLADQNLADTLKKLGKAMSAVGRYEDAIEIFGEALQINQAAVTTMKQRYSGGHVGHSQVLVAQENVAQVMQCIGEVQESCGNLDEAMLIHVSTLMLRRQNTSLQKVQSSDGVETAISMSGIGSVHLRKGEYEDATAVLEEALRIFKNSGLPDDHSAVAKAKQLLSEAERGLQASLSPVAETKPETRKERKDHTLTLDAKARDLVDEGDYNGAIRILTQVLVKRRQRLTKQQKASGTSQTKIKERDEVARTLCAFAEVLMKKGDFEQATVLLEESKKMYLTNGVSEQDQRVKDIVAELDRVREYVY